MGEKLSERLKNWIAIFLNIVTIIAMVIGFWVTWSNFGAENEKIKIELENLKAEKYPEQYACGASYIYYYPNQSGSDRHEWLGIYLQNDISLKDLKYMINIFPENADKGVRIKLIYNDINFGENKKELSYDNYSEISWGNIPQGLHVVNYNLSWNKSWRNQDIITGDEITIQVSVNQNLNIINITGIKALTDIEYNKLINEPWQGCKK